MAEAIDTPHSKEDFKGQEDLFCPSARGEAGAILLGIIQEGGTVAFIPTKVEVTPEFIAIASRGWTLEKRFRFAAPCIKEGCKQWTGTSCSVVDRLASHVQPVETEYRNQLPKCSIRANCRWFAEKGIEACQVCPLVITNISRTEE
jgi:hypothetical protein